MKPIQHITNNAVLSPPAGSTAEEVAVLPITRLVYDGRYLAIRSFWKPTPEELAALNAGEPVCFEIFTDRTHPPISLGVYGVTMSTTVPLQ